MSSNAIYAIWYIVRVQREVGNYFCLKNLPVGTVTGAGTTDTVTLYSALPFTAVPFAKHVKAELSPIVPMDAKSQSKVAMVSTVPSLCVLYVIVVPLTQFGLSDSHHNCVIPGFAPRTEHFRRNLSLSLVTLYTHWPSPFSHWSILTNGSSAKAGKMMRQQ